MVAGKLGAVVESDGLAQFRREWFQQVGEAVGDGLRLEAGLGDGQGDPRVTLVSDQERGAWCTEEHAVGFPVAWDLT